MKVCTKLGAYIDGQFCRVWMDGERGFVLPYLLLSREDSAHREHDLRAVCNGVRYIADGQPMAVHAARLSSLACDYQQMQRWMR